MFTAEQKQKIINFYHPQLEGGEYTNNFSLIKNGKKYYFNSLNKTSMVLGFGKQFSSLEEAKKDSEVVITTPGEFFKNYFPEQYDKIYDKRTLKYLESCKNNNGLINIKHGHDGEKFETQLSYQIWANLTGGGIEVGKLQDGNWVAEYSYRCGIDDYVIVDLYFENKPTKKNILTVNLIEKIEEYFNWNGWHNVTFECWECGAKTHWLDVPGSLEEKWECFKERYCNLC